MNTRARKDFTTQEKSEWYESEPHCQYPITWRRQWSRMRSLVYPRRDRANSYAGYCPYDGVRADPVWWSCRENSLQPGSKYSDNATKRNGVFSVLPQ